MSFRFIDYQNWERKEYYEHFINEVVCTYSTTVNLDITNLKGMRLYPTIIWVLTKVVNQMPEFRTALTDKGLGIYDDMHPAYTIFNKENKSFPSILAKIAHWADTSTVSYTQSQANIWKCKYHRQDMNVDIQLTILAFDLHVDKSQFKDDRYKKISNELFISNKKDKTKK